MVAVNLYGLVVESDWPLPECIPYEGVNTPNVRFLLGEVPAEGILADSENPWVQTTDSACWINFEGVARYLISSGREIRVQPYTNRDDPMVRLFLLGTALSVLLQQRGLLPIHGNAIEVNDGCLVCVGESGAGKSTLATAFLQQGFRLLADDVVPVDQAGLAWPGFPRIRLWGETASKFAIETTGLPRILPEMDKYQIPLGPGFCNAPLPVKWLYVLEAHDAETFEILPYEGMARFEPLHQNTYRVQYLEHFAMKSKNLQQVTDLAGKIHMAKIRRPKQGFRLPELVEFILGDVKRHS